MLSLNDEQMLSLTSEQMAMLSDAQALLPNEAARGRFMKIFEARVMSKRPRLIKPDDFQVRESINFGLSEVGVACGPAVIGHHQRPKIRSERNADRSDRRSLRNHHRS